MKTGSNQIALFFSFLPLPNFFNQLVKPYQTQKKGKKTGKMQISGKIKEDY